MIKVIGFILLVSIRYGSAQDDFYEMSEQHPLKSCKTSTLLDKPEACEEKTYDQKECSSSKRLQSALEVKNQQDFGTCVFASLSTELNYLFRRLYSENDYELPWTYLSVIGRGTNVNSCPLTEALDTIKNQGSYHDRAFYNIKNFEKNLIVNKGRGLCYSDNKDMLDYFPNDLFNSTLYLDAILKIKKDNSLLSNYPIFSNYIDCQNDILKKSNKTIEQLKEIDFDQYITELKTCFSLKGLNSLSKNPTCSGDIALNLANLAYEQGVSAEFDNLDRDNSSLDFLEQYLSAFLKCGKVDGASEKNRFIKENHHSISLYPQYTKDGTFLVDRVKEEFFLENCQKKKSKDECYLEVDKQDDIREPFFNVMKKAFSGKKQKDKRPISISVNSALFNNPVFKQNSDGGHLMNIIGVSECEKRKCILIHNSWGDQNQYSIDSEDTVAGEVSWKELKKLDILPFTAKQEVYDEDLKLTGNILDYSRFWLCGDEITKYLNRIHYVKTSRDLLQTSF